MIIGSIFCLDLISEKRNMKADLIQERLKSGCLTVYIYTSCFHNYQQKDRNQKELI